MLLQQKLNNKEGEMLPIKITIYCTSIPNKRKGISRKNNNTQGPCPLNMLLISLMIHVITV